MKFSSGGNDHPQESYWGWDWSLMWSYSRKYFKGVLYVLYGRYTWGDWSWSFVRKLLFKCLIFCVEINLEVTDYSSGNYSWGDWSHFEATQEGTTRSYGSYICAYEVIDTHLKVTHKVAERPVTSTPEVRCAILYWTRECQSFREEPMCTLHCVQCALCAGFSGLNKGMHSVQNILKSKKVY